MVKPIIIIVGAIPAIIALLIAVPLITKPEIPFSASTPSDVIELEYTKYHLEKISFTVTDRFSAQKSEILVIKNNGNAIYRITEEGITKPEQSSQLDDEIMKKLKALIKETGFMFIPSESFPVENDVDEYLKSSLKISFNDQVNQIHWPEQNATKKFVPPIITIVETELDQIIAQLIE